ncbi:hypothetical protein PTSG_07015 [Salpingoeca rosetta]|uniref:FCP1 homology domain-containing protein n=1 Tax=Salpingoeca rosetta (strain ATCC 50818 / BSB-021) TaxID=946362 RepID=F2UDT2_SALR5|nr:uncharacterized protein PTSG_07015 [Salpingoeca rosetta]EGD74782.1 hypothetical protein PTSG_07015 [Salpingoeca rosetta]|eukprot:XP_004992427.1 hypothetical protein PTSG_07015 [Salpingoeca rosetta]
MSDRADEEEQPQQLQDQQKQQQQQQEQRDNAGSEPAHQPSTPKTPDRPPSRFQKVLQTVTEVFSSPSSSAAKKGRGKRTAQEREDDEDEDGGEAWDTSTADEPHASTATTTTSLDASIITSAIPSPVKSPSKRPAKAAKRDSWIPASLFPWASLRNEEAPASSSSSSSSSSPPASSSRRDSSYVAAIFSPLLSVFRTPDADAAAQTEPPASSTSTATTSTRHAATATSTTATATTATTTTTSSTAARATPTIGAPADLREANRPESHDLDHLTGLSDDMIRFLRSPPRYPLFSKPGPLLPPAPKDGRMTLVLDLDETLVHSLTTPVADADVAFDISAHGQSLRIYTRVRPHARDFLRRVAQRYEVVLFTASMQVYADALLEQLDPHNEFFHHRLFREHCDFQFGIHLKNLTRLGRDLRRVMLVDNSPQVFAYQLSNGIPIITWSQDRADRSLAILADYLDALADMNPSDVRPYVRDRFRLHEQLGRSFSPLMLDPSGSGEAMDGSPPRPVFFAPSLAHGHAHARHTPPRRPHAVASPSPRRLAPRFALPRRQRRSLGPDGDDTNGDDRHDKSGSSSNTKADDDERSAFVATASVTNGRAGHSGDSSAFTSTASLTASSPASSPLSSSSYIPARRETMTVEVMSSSLAEHRARLMARRPRARRNSFRTSFTASININETHTTTTTTTTDNSSSSSSSSISDGGDGGVGSKGKNGVRRHVASSPASKRNSGVDGGIAASTVGVGSPIATRRRRIARPTAYNTETATTTTTTTTPSSATTAATTTTETAISTETATTKAT